ncbi:MAG TPA: hypothetical protein VGL40_08505 [Bacillota bacterium]
MNRHQARRLALTMGLVLAIPLALAGCSRGANGPVVTAPWSAPESVNYVWMKAGQQVGTATFAVTPTASGFVFVATNDFSPG